jgi:adenosylmethionine-8-amino-7-oxononanoate aminotransferase
MNLHSLILHRTSREQSNKGITVMARGEGTRLTDQQGKSYLDLVSGVTRPVHVGYGQQEIALGEISHFPFVFDGGSGR